jgi:hypothetical protein
VHRAIELLSSSKMDGICIRSPYVENCCSPGLTNSGHIVQFDTTKIHIAIRRRHNIRSKRCLVGLPHRFVLHSPQVLPCQTHASPTSHISKMPVLESPIINSGLYILEFPTAPKVWKGGTLVQVPVIGYLPMFSQLVRIFFADLGSSRRAFFVHHFAS